MTRSGAGDVEQTLHDVTVRGYGRDVSREPDGDLVISTAQYPASEKALRSGQPTTTLGMGAAPARSESRRYAWMDAARGIGIVLVVIGHVAGGLTDAKIAAGAAWAWLDYTLYSFHMPVFFLLAGINIPKSLQYGRDTFLVSKAWNLGYPYILWSVIQGAVLVELSRFTNTHMEWHNLLEIGWKPIAQYWFLYALLVAQIGGMLLLPRPSLMVVALVSTLVAMQFPFLSVTGERFMQAFAFVLVGMLASQNLLQWQPRRPLLFGILTGCLFLLSLPVTIWLSGINYYAAAAWPSTILGILTVLYFAQVPGNFQAIWSAVGQASKTIYVLHLFAAAGARILIHRLHITDSAGVLLIVATSIGVGVPFAAHSLLKRANLLWPLGLAPLARLSKSRGTAG